MSFFKKKITLSQLIADCIFNSVNFYNANSEKLIPMADEFKVLDSNDTAELKELGYSLIIVDLIISCQINFSRKISNEEIGEATSFLYAKLLKEEKHLDEDEIDKKMNACLRLLSLLETSEGGDKTAEGQKLLLCTAFAKMYSGDNLRDKKVQGKNFAAFKLAKSIIKSDLIGTALKDFKVIVK